jgi:hypothetical protein
MEDKKKEILSFFKDLDFNEKHHQYFVKGERIKLSVSGIIKKFVEPFDTEKISRRVAAKRGVNQDEVFKEWDNAKNKACKKGTKVHLFGELYPLNRHLKPRNKFEEAVVKFWNDVPSTIIPVVMELQMYHKDFMFAGTADILMYNTVTDTFIIGDYKTNKDLFKNYQGKKMLSPFGDLLDCPYNKYQLQLSFYQILFEQLGLKVSSRKLIWLRPTGQYELYNTEDYTGILKDYLKHNEL